MLVRTLMEHKVDGKAKAEGEVYDLESGAVADAVERELVEVVPKAELRELRDAAVDAGVAGDASDLQASAAAAIEHDVAPSSGRGKSGNKGKR